MNKKKIVIASVLKPVNDSRNYEKTAISISKSGNYEVQVVGQAVLSAVPEGSVLFRPLYSFARLGLKRAGASVAFFRYLMAEKPDLIIVATVELLLPAVLYKFFSRTRLVYDVQENYYRNLLYTNAFPPVIKHLLAFGVRLLEYATRPWIDHYLLAEKNYEQEFSFTKKKSTILENKTRKATIKVRDTDIRAKDSTIRLLYSGTIAENYGIFEAVQLAKDLHEQEPSIRLKIIGYAAQESVMQRLEKTLADCPFITLCGGRQPVPHAQIMEAIAEADLGLIAYRPNKSTENCIPTKLYEYLACGLPYVLPPNPAWEAYTKHYGAGLVVDYQKPDVEQILAALREKIFYKVKPGEEVYWESEEKKLQAIIRKMLA